MKHHTPTMMAALAIILTACSDTGPIQPPQPTSPDLAAAERRPEPNKRIDILDECEPVSFNAALGEGSCVRAGKVTFATFIQVLTARGSVETWRFSPSVVEGRVGQVLLATNRGGEVHTFTEVEKFGGGIVPLLNKLSHSGEITPECRALAADDFLAPGATDSDDEVENGTELYQCCIHPWMRTVVHGHSG